MVELIMRWETREGDKQTTFEIDFDDYPQFDPNDESCLAWLEGLVFEGLEASYAE